jgi:hypothetical protein
MFEEQKKAYWRMRDELLTRYASQWVAIANGALVANGDSASRVMLEAYRKTGNKVLYVNKVGDEKQAMRKRIRHYTVGRYDLAYDPPAPIAEARLQSLDGEHTAKDDFFLDTGADITVLQQPIGKAFRCTSFPSLRQKLMGLGTVGR